jgi:hypothetical protein
VLSDEQPVSKMKSSRIRQFALALPLLALFASLAAAQAPLIIDFQGRLTFNANGSGVDGVRSTTLAIYDVATGGSPLWSETHSINYSSGYFDVLLGGSTPLTNLNFNRRLYLQVTVAGDALSPRLNFSKSGFVASLSGRIYTNGTTVVFNGTVQNMTVVLTNASTVYVNGTPVMYLTFTEAECLTDPADAGKHLLVLNTFFNTLTLTPTSSPVTNDTLGLPNGTVVQLVTGTCDFTAGPTDCYYATETNATPCSAKGYCEATASCTAIGGVDYYAIHGGVRCSQDTTWIDGAVTTCPAFGGACLFGNDNAPITTTDWLGRCYMDVHPRAEESAWAFFCGYPDYDPVSDDYGEGCVPPRPGPTWQSTKHDGSGDAGTVEAWALCCPYNNFP